MMSKSELIQKIADEASLAKRDVKAALDTLAAVAYKEMKKSGEFLLPGFAKFIVVKKPATKERTGINPFTKEPTVFQAKPARKMLKVPLPALTIHCPGRTLTFPNLVQRSRPNSPRTATCPSNQSGYGYLKSIVSKPD